MISPKWTKIKLHEKICSATMRRFIVLKHMPETLDHGDGWQIPPRKGFEHWPDTPLNRVGFDNLRCFLEWVWGLVNLHRTPSSILSHWLFNTGCLGWHFEIHPGRTWLLSLSVAFHICHLGLWLMWVHTSVSSNYFSFFKCSFLNCRLEVHTHYTHAHAYVSYWVANLVKLSMDIYMHW